MTNKREPSDITLATKLTPDASPRAAVRQPRRWVHRLHEIQLPTPSRRDSLQQLNE
jgi:hypothetical protein